MPDPAPDPADFDDVHGEVSDLPRARPPARRRPLDIPWEEAVEWTFTEPDPNAKELQ